MALLLVDAYISYPCWYTNVGSYGLFYNFCIKHAIIHHLPKNSYQICLVVAFLLTLQKDSF